MSTIAARILASVVVLLALALTDVFGRVRVLVDAPIVAVRAVPESFAQGNECVAIADFSRDAVGEFPGAWKPRDEAGRGVYRVMEEQGVRFVRAEARESGVPAGLQVDTWDLNTHPVLAWRWRPLEFPRGADERRGRRNDSALGVYTVFPHPVTARSLKYVWSAAAPVGTEFSASLGLTHGRVLRTGPGTAGRWYEERVNVRDDFRRRFGDDVPRPVGLGVLTDADATNGTARGDYGDFRVCREG